MPTAKPRPRPRCAKCDIARRRQPYAMCEFHRKRYRRDWCRGNRERTCVIRKRCYEKCKRDVLEHYSNGTLKCRCCGENIYAFLTIDHINGDGQKHRKEIRARIHSWLRRNHYPKGYQVLCFNCNCGRSVNHGICPHKERTHQKK